MITKKQIARVKKAIVEQVSLNVDRNAEQYVWRFEESIYDQATLSIIENYLTGFYSFEACLKRVRELFPGWFVYAGDNHIAVHFTSGEHKAEDGTDMNPRLLMIVAKEGHRIL